MNITHFNLHILTLAAKFNDLRICKHVMISLIQDYYTGKPSSKRFKQRFPVYHKRLVKTSENQSFIFKKSKLIFCDKSHRGFL